MFTLQKTLPTVSQIQPMNPSKLNSESLTFQITKGPSKAESMCKGSQWSTK